MNMQMNIAGMAIAMPRMERRHPNRLPFRGVLTLVDVASDRAPSGARGHKVMLTSGAAKRALPSLLGMALDYTPELDGHDARRKVGIVTEADIVGRDVRVGGYVFARDFPEVVQALRGNVAARAQPAWVVRASSGEVRSHPIAPKPGAIRVGQPGDLKAEASPLGMSYELAEVRLKDPRAPVWTITDAIFTGAAVLRRDKAAYRGTWIEVDKD